VHVATGIYEHHDGRRCRVVGTACDPGEPRTASPWGPASAAASVEVAAVVYVPLHPSDGPGLRVCPVAEFCAEVSPGVPRFRHLPDAGTDGSPAARRLRAGTDVRDEDVDAVVRAACAFDLVLPSVRYPSLSLCVLDAVFAPNAGYDAVRGVVDRYAAWAGVGTSTDAARPTEEQALHELVAQVEGLGPERFAAEVVRNRQRTRTSREAPLKAAAAGSFARVLVGAGVERRSDLARLRADEPAVGRLDGALGEVPGHGDGVRLARFHVLAGDEYRVTTGRHLLIWLGEVLGVPVSPAAARVLVARSASALSVTPWVLGDAVWRARSTAARGPGRRHVAEVGSPPSDTVSPT